MDKLPKAQNQKYNQKKHYSNQIFYPNQNNGLYPDQRPSFSNQQQNSNNNINSEINQSLDTDLLIARLGALGGIIQTIGGVISTSASLLALQEIQNDLKSQSSSANATLRGSGTVLTGDDPTNNSTTSSSVNNHSNARINELEKQVEYLMKELHSLKNSNKKKRI